MARASRPCALIPANQRRFKNIEVLEVRRDFTSFHGNELIKQKYLTRVREHRIADEIVKGYYWKDGKGCAVGCTLHSSNHWCYEDELGIPNHLAYIQDELFEALSNPEAKMFPEQFLEIIPVGMDLYPVLWKFMLFVLLDETNGLVNFNENKKVIRQTANFFQRAIDGEEITLDEYVTFREAMVTPSAQFVQGVLDTLDPLDPRAAVKALYTMDELAGRDFEAAREAADTWDAMDALERTTFTNARALVWRDKLLECLSQA